MPFGDGSGPRGMGPRSGRGLGFCAGFGAPGYANPGPGYGRGFGGGRGFGRGRGFGFKAGWRASQPAAYAQSVPYREPLELSREEKLKILKAEKDDIALELKAVEEEIKDLQRKK